MSAVFIFYEEIIMLAKICDRCHKRHDYNNKCDCYKLKNVKLKTDLYNVDVKQFYNTADWEKAKSKAMQRTHGLDPISLILYNRIEQAFTVHHIIPLVDDYSKRIDIDNLIPLTEKNHRMIHKMYKKDFKGTVNMINNIISEFTKLYGRGV